MLIEVDSTPAGCEGALVVYELAVYELAECRRAFGVCLCVVEVGKGNY